MQQSSFNNRDPLFIVGSSVAKTPANLGGAGSANGDQIIIPSPPGSQRGDLLYAITSGTAISSDGWRITIQHRGLSDGLPVATVWEQIHDGTSLWTWQNINTAHSRGGCIVAIRGGGSTFAAIKTFPVLFNPYLIPDLRAGSIDDSIWLGFLMSASNNAAADTTVQGGHVKLVEHVCNDGNVKSVKTVISALSPIRARQLVSRQTYDDPQNPVIAGTFVAAVIVNPA